MNNDKKFQSSAREKSFMRRCLALLTCVGMLGSFMMPYQGVLPVIAEDGDEETIIPDLVCGLEEHTHSEECYSLICEEDSEEHEHDDACYELICGLEEHHHNESCYANSSNDYVLEMEESSEEENFVGSSLETSMITLNSSTMILAGDENFDGGVSTKSSPPRSGKDKPNDSDTAPYFPTPATEVGEHTHEVTESQITGVKVTIAGTDYEADLNKTLPEQTSDVISDVHFVIDYVIAKQGNGDNKVSPVTLESPCIFYQLPDGVVVPDEYCGYYRYSEDSLYLAPDGSHRCGYYSISKDGLIVIQFTKDYIEHKISTSDSFTGRLDFKGNLERNNTQSGDRAITIGGLTLNIPFSNKSSTVSKSGKKISTSGGETEIEWTITVNNQVVPAKLDGWTLVDEMFNQSNISNIVVDPADAGSFNGNTFTFGSGGNMSSAITFKYTETVSSETYNQKILDAGDGIVKISENTATLKDTNGDESSSTSYVQGDRPTIHKSGETSYQKGVWIGGTIYWTVEVSAVEGGSLGGYIIYDTAWNGADVDDGDKEVLKLAGGKDTKDEEIPATDANNKANAFVITAVDSKGNSKTLSQGTDFTLDTTTGKVKLKDGLDITKATITYVTDCRNVPKGDNSVRKLKNTTQIYYDETHPGPKEEAPIEFTSAVYSLDQKRGEFNHDTNKMVWYVGAEIANKENNKIVLNSSGTNFRMHDEAFKYITIDDIKLESANWKNQNINFTLKTKDGNRHIVDDKGNDYGYLELNTTTGVLDITGGTQKEGTNPVEYEYALHALRLSYEMDLSAIKNTSSEGLTSRDGKYYYKGMEVTFSDGKIIYSNTVDNDAIGRDPEDVISKVGTGTIESRSKIAKRVTYDGANSGYYRESNSNDTKTLHWTVDLVEDEKFKANSVFTDILSSENGISHTFGDDINLVVKMRSTTTEKWTEIDKKNYTLTKNSNTFSIEFKNNLDYVYAQISYDSIANTGAVKGTGDSWETASETFKNNSSYKENLASDKFTYTNENPAIIRKFDMNVTKAWSENAAKPDTIYYRLQRRFTGDYSESSEEGWEYIYPSGSTWETVEPNLNDEESYSFKAERRTGYRYEWLSLPKDAITDEETMEHSADYEYRVVEVAVSGFKPVYVNNHITYDSASKTVSLTNKEGNSIHKYVLDKNGNRIEGNRVAVGDLIVSTEWERRVNGVGSNVTLGTKGEAKEYYYIPYEIELDILDSVGHRIFDTIPEGFEFAYSVAKDAGTCADFRSDYQFQPYYIGDFNSGSMQFPQYGQVFVQENGNPYPEATLDVSSDNYGFLAYDGYPIEFVNIKSGVKKIFYYIRIEKDVLDNRMESSSVIPLKNEVEDYEKTMKSDVTVLLSKEKTDHEETSLISKDVASSLSGDGSGGYMGDRGILKYQLIVNPEAKKLAPVGQSTYDITDILNVVNLTVDDVTYTDIGEKVDIESVTAREITLKEGVSATDGKYTQNDIEISPNPENVTYSYVPGGDSVSKTDVTNQYYFVFGKSNNIYTLERNGTNNYPKTDEVNLTIRGTYNTNMDFLGGSVATVAISDGIGSTTNWVIKPNGDCTGNISITGYTYDDQKGTYSVSCRLKDFPYDVNSIQFSHWGEGNITYSFDAKNGVVCTSALRSKKNDSGELVITVPDSKALLIEYSYVVDSDLIPKEGGFPMVVDNEASIDTGNVSAWDKESGTVFNVSKSTARNATENPAPTLIKRDAHDYNLLIGADFYVAYYDGSRWIFSGEPTNKKDDKTKENIHMRGVNNVDLGVIHELAFNVQANGNEIPEGARKISLKDTDNIVSNEIIDLTGHYNLDLESNRIYKFIEVPTQSGYQGTDVLENIAGYDSNTQSVKWTPSEESEITFTTFEQVLKDYLANQTKRDSDATYPFRNFFKNYTSTFYFAYDVGQNAKYPIGISRDNIKNVVQHGDFRIENTNVATLKVEKQWNGQTTWSNENAKVNLKLYYSTKKTSDGTLPDNLTVVTASALGLDAIQNPVELTQAQTTVTWNNLPTTIGGERIYYYVREEGYTEDGTTWYLRKNENVYQTTSEEIGAYRPIYDGNGTSGIAGTESTILINNVNELSVKKLWLAYDGTELDSTKIPVEEIDVTLYGIRSDNGNRDVLLESDQTPVTIEASKNWIKVFTSEEMSKMKLQNYSRLIAEEVKDENIEGFAITNGSIPASQQGQITIVNQDQSSETITVSGKKEWESDNLPENVSATLTLYRSTDYVTSTKLSTIAIPENKVSNAELQQYDSNNELNDKVLIGNNQTVTWTKLPSRDDSGKRYYYYVVETARNPSDEYADPIYIGNGISKNGTITVRNVHVDTAKLNITKGWFEESDNDRPDSIQVRLYRKAVTSLKLTHAKGFRVGSILQQNQVNQLSVSSVGANSPLSKGSATRTVDVVENKAKVSLGNIKSGDSISFEIIGAGGINWVTLSSDTSNYIDGGNFSSPYTFSTYSDTPQYLIFNLYNTDNNSKIRYTIERKELTLTSDKVTILAGGSGTVTYKDADGAVTCTPSDGSGLSAEAKNGTITISAKDDNATSGTITVSDGAGTKKTITVEVVPKLSAKIDKEEVDVGDYVTITTNKAVKWEYDSDVFRYEKISDTEYRFTAIGSEDTKSTIKSTSQFDGDTQAEFTVSVKMVYNPVKPTIPEGAELLDKVITLVKVGDSYVPDKESAAFLSNLPVTDGTKKSYKYYIEEVTNLKTEVNGKNGSVYFPYQYSNGDGIVLSPNVEKTLTVYNKKNDTPSPPPEGADLPTSGGSGTAPYRTAGFLLMMTAVTFPYIKRKRRILRNNAHD